MLTTITIRVSLLDGTTQYGAEAPDQLEKLARFFLHQRLVDQTARALALFDIPSMIRPAAAVDAGPTIPYVVSVLDGSPESLLSKQASYFNEVGIIADDQNLSVPFLHGNVRFQIERLEALHGSFLAKFKATITIEAAKKFGQKLFVAVLVDLLASTIVGHAPRSPELPVPPAVHYVCTIDGNVSGDPESLIDAAKHDLYLSQPSSPDRTREVWKSRQICLKAAGFDPGRIDGARGVDTIRAEKQFEYFHSVKVNWNSQVFQRYIIKIAQKHYSGASNDHREISEGR